MQIAKKGNERHVWATALLVSAVLFMAAGFSACQTGSSANGGPPPAVADATVSFCDSNEGGCTPATAFSVASLRDLVVSVNWENLSTGNHTQLLEILQPGGGLYQASQSSFLAGDDSHGSMTMTRSLPVAGTWISQRRITGDWSVRVSLDGKAITTQALQLNP